MESKFLEIPVEHVPEHSSAIEAELGRPRERNGDHHTSYIRTSAPSVYEVQGPLIAYKSF